MSREELVQEIVENLSRCQRPMREVALKNSGLSRAQIGMLFMIAHHKRLQVKQIADHLGITKSAASQLLEPLSQKKFIKRQVDPNDRRIARFQLSEEGLKELKRFHKLKYAGLRSSLESLSEDELDQLAGLSRKLATTAGDHKTKISG
jgi:DNA-binding MarR family transcriptional regulator